eukprot:scpid92374/ scgid2860/ 
MEGVGSEFIESAQISTDLLRRYLVSRGQRFSSLECRSLSVISGAEFTEIVSPTSVVLTSNGTPVRISRLVVKPDGDYSFECLFGGTAHNGNCFRNLQLLDTHVEDMLPESGLKFCPGIEDQKTIFSSVRFDSKQLRRWSFPFQRVDSNGCTIMHRVKRSAIGETALPIVACTSCKRLRRQLLVLKSRAEERSEADTKRDYKKRKQQHKQKQEQKQRRRSSSSSSSRVPSF